MINWIASYPKSGSTWVRMLLNSYLTGGYLNINTPFWGKGDNASYYYKAVSPKQFDELTEQDMIALRPAALMHIVESSIQTPLFIKSHHSYGYSNQIHLFPSYISRCAFYLLRDPREIAPSLSDHMQVSIDETIQHMADEDFTIMKSKQNFHMISSWSNHVKNWLSHKDFPVYTIKYKDLKSDPGKILHSIIKCLNLTPNSKLIDKAVESTEMTKLQAQEAANGFIENPSDKKFFGGERRSLTASQKHQIETDHAKMMELL